MNDPIASARGRALPRLRRAVLRGWPRLAVSGMLAVTALAGFLSSAALLRLGVDGMGLRYAGAVAIAYGAFLAQLRAWVALVRRRHEVREERARRAVRDAGDGGGWDGAVELPELRPEGWAGGGGRFAGGGASGHFAPDAPGLAPPGAADAGGPELGLDLDLDLDLPLLALVVLAALVGSGALAAAWIVSAAPSLLAELLFDGVVAGVLYRRVRRGAAPPWWRGALSRTWLPALAVLALFTVGGLVLEKAVPGARSIGDVLRAIVG